MDKIYDKTEWVLYTRKNKEISSFNNFADKSK